MDKKILVAAVAAAMMAPSFASADVKLYGIAQAEYNVEDTSTTDSVQGVDDDATRSRIGIKFSEKLGGGLKAFGKFEFQLDPSDGEANPAKGDGRALVQRDAHLGLKSSWGSIAAGSFHAPYKTAGGVKWDPWTATHLQARRAGGMTGGSGIGGTNGFIRNAIYYTSPNVNGFKVQFAIIPDETNTKGNNNNGDQADNDYSLAVQYKNGPWHAIFAHNRNNQPSGTSDETLTKVGLRWKHAAWTFAGQYEVVNNASASAKGGTPALNSLNYSAKAGNDADILWLNAQYKVGNNIFTVSYGNTDVNNATGKDFDYTYWATGVIHKFSKKTRIFAGYTQTDGDKNGTTADRDAWTVGMRKDF